MKARPAHIITYHNSHSYGACLQAHASQVVLEKLGFNIRFIRMTELPAPLGLSGSFGDLTKERCSFQIDFIHSSSSLAIKRDECLLWMKLIAI